MAAQLLLGAGSLAVAANTYDAAIVTHDTTVTRTNDAAIATRHLLHAEGATPGTTAAVCDATDQPIGPIDNTETSTDVEQSVLLLGRGPTKKMVASKAIAIGDKVYTDASGKVTDTPVIGCYFVGIANTAATTDGHVIEVKDCAPVLVNDWRQVITMAVVASAADSLAIPVTHRYVAKTTGADAEALTLADGIAGQSITIALVVDGGGTGTLTPATCSGFATIVFADAGDTASLTYVDDTTGWVLDGTAGVAAPPVITV